MRLTLSRHGARPIDMDISDSEAEALYVVLSKALHPETVVSWDLKETPGPLKLGTMRLTRAGAQKLISGGYDPRPVAMEHARGDARSGRPRWQCACAPCRSARLYLPWKEQCIKEFMKERVEQRNRTGGI